MRGMLVVAICPMRTRGRRDQKRSGINELHLKGIEKIELQPIKLLLKNSSTSKSETGHILRCTVHKDKANIKKTVGVGYAMHAS